MIPDNRNLVEARPTFVTHLECSATGEHYPADRLHNLSRVGKPLLVRYDLAGVRAVLTKELLASRPADLWRYRELLPVRSCEHIVSLGESTTPLVQLTRSVSAAGEVLVKDEGRLPTGSFKARGVVMAVSMARALGVTEAAMPTNGNAGAAFAAYCSRAGIRATVFCPQDTPEVNVREIAAQGASVYRVNGLIDDCGKLVGAGAGVVRAGDVAGVHGARAGRGAGPREHEGADVRPEAGAVPDAGPDRGASALRAELESVFIRPQ